MREWIDNLADETGDEMVVMDGFDDCIAGVVERFGQPDIVCYDRARVVDSLQRDGMSSEESEEYFQFNQIGARVGDTTPCFLRKPNS